MGPRSSALKWEARCTSFQIRRVPVRFREDCLGQALGQGGRPIGFLAKEVTSSPAPTPRSTVTQ